MRPDAERVAARRRHKRAPILIGVATVFLIVGCRNDGRDLRPPNAPLPPTTTTSTTVPLDSLGTGGTVDVPIP